jgi:hypothetical protein
MNRITELRPDFVNFITVPLFFRIGIQTIIILMVAGNKDGRVRLLYCQKVHN